MVSCKYILFLILILFFNSCSSILGGNDDVEISRSEGYRVQVESGGSVLKNPEQKLIHRIRIRSHQVRKVFGTKDVPKVPRLFVKKSYDREGAVVGLEIIKGSSLSRAIGLIKGDILTAIGKRQLKTKEDLKYFSELLSTQEEVTFTFDRNSVAHKTIIYVTD